MIPPGQRCSQLLRAFFLSAIGPSFRFDAAMREFVLTANGAATLGDAVEHWQLSRQQDRKLGRQFELNRFTRQWHVDHPTGIAEQRRLGGVGAAGRDASAGSGAQDATPRRQRGGGT